MTSSAITPTGLNSTLTPRGDATTGRVSEAAASKTTVVYGIRPEHMALADNGVPAVVQVVEPTGAEIQVFVKIGEQPVTALLREPNLVTIIREPNRVQSRRALNCVAHHKHNVSSRERLVGAGHCVGHADRKYQIACEHCAGHDARARISSS